MRFPGDRLVIATHNSGKMAEFGEILGGRGIALISARELGLAEPPETAGSFAGNAAIKARAALAATGLPVLADDSGLEVAALGGDPGVATADWAEGPGGRDFGRAMQRVRTALGDAPQPWTARFRCTLVLALPGGVEDLVEGLVDGVLTWPPRGPFGHGFDPMFVPEGETLTFAEMSTEAKNAISHRARAIRALADRWF
jgi:XTP/dITP diphosphohydrolase